MLRVRCKSCFAIVLVYGLKSEVSESTVSLGHTVHIFFSLEGAALFVVSVHDFGSEFVGHGFAAALACVADHVLHRN